MGASTTTFKGAFWYTRRVDCILLRPVCGDVERLGRDGKVEIRLAVRRARRPGDGITGFFQVVGEQGRRLEQCRAHVVRADAGGIATGDEAGAAGSTDRGVRETAREARSLRRQTVHVRRDGV